VSHPDVDLVSFIGGLVTGKRVAAAAAATVKKVALELGGKNPNVIFADARFDAAVDNALNAAFVNSGQVCSAGARLIVAEELHVPSGRTGMLCAAQNAGGGPRTRPAEPSLQGAGW